MTFTEFANGVSSVFRFASMLLGVIYISVTVRENLFEDPSYTILVFIFYYVVFSEHLRRSHD